MTRHNESQLQSVCVRWFKFNPKTNNHLIFAIPNGGKRSKHEAAIMQGEGVLAGIPDLQIILKGGHVFFIEMKTGHNKLTTKQTEMHSWLNELGIKVYVCYNLDQFIECVEYQVKLHKPFKPIPFDIITIPYELTNEVSRPICKHMIDGEDVPKPFEGLDSDK